MARLYVQQKRILFFMGISRNVNPSSKEINSEKYSDNNICEFDSYELLPEEVKKLEENKKK